jgi:hypothetical protein
MTSFSTWRSAILPRIIVSGVQSSGSRNILIGAITRTQQDVWGITMRRTAGERHKYLSLLYSAHRDSRSIQRTTELIPRLFPHGKVAKA